MLRAGDPAPEPYVVVATFDTGANPFHPTWRRDLPHHPATRIPGYPHDAAALDLALEDDFVASWAASKDELERLHDRSVPLYHVPGTNLVGLWSRDGDHRPVFDRQDATHYHGARASSQIGGMDHGTAPEAFVVAMDRTKQDAQGNGQISATAGVAWAIEQPWIDIIHLNVAEFGPLLGSGAVADLVEQAVDAGKLIVVAGGNGVANAGVSYPTELSSISGPRGALVAGANDNCGYAYFSNLDPHVVMDGLATVAAHETQFSDASFGGTSSASPRTAGYAAAVLLEVRRSVGDVHGLREGALVLLEGEAPEAGPLADGRLDVHELHEVIRKTADPNPHASKYDGGAALPGLCIPQPADPPAAMYAKMGYGEVSEHTLPHAVAVLLGEAPMPDRPVEDAFYESSERLREAWWG